MSQFDTQIKTGNISQKCTNPNCIVPGCKYKISCWAIFTQTCTTCHQVFDSISTRATHSANCTLKCEKYGCEFCKGIIYVEDEIADHVCPATNTQEPLDEYHNTCSYCNQYFATQEQYYAHKSACSEEYDMELWKRDTYEDEYGWREYQDEEEE